MKIALVGYGKMGKTIEALAKEMGHEVVYKSTSNTSEGNLKEAEVAIEFSTPEVATNNIKNLLNQGIPVVSGTTGWLDDYEEIKEFCKEKNGSFLHASNFSIGVNLFFNITSFAAKLMSQWKEYEVSIEEIHHTEKKDAPSGTAIRLAELIMEHTDKQDRRVDGESEEELRIVSKREADVKGTHIIQYKSEIDDIELKHTAHSREGFAKGAILAAEWIKEKKGVFQMKDVLGL